MGVALSLFSNWYGRLCFLAGFPRPSPGAGAGEGAVCGGCGGESPKPRNP